MACKEDRLIYLAKAQGLRPVALVQGLYSMARWPNRKTGWEGRLRMTASLVLRKIVADDGVLHVPGEPDRFPREEFIQRYETK